MLADSRHCSCRGDHAVVGNHRGDDDHRMVVVVVDYGDCDDYNLVLKNGKC